MRKVLAALTFLLSSPAFAQTPSLTAEPVVSGFNLPVFATAPADDPRLFVLEQTGFIRIIEDGALKEAPFLDISDKVSNGNEQGLLGLAFHPDYAENGRFFIDYTDRNGATQVVAYTVSSDPDGADPASAQPLLSVDQPFRNHNGGWLGFDADGLLYISTGDGGSGGDPGNRAQNPDTLLGKLLRIDVDKGAPYAIPDTNPFAKGGGAAEVYFYGLRNPWRVAFDGDVVYIADVGQNAIEEINVLPRSEAGANLGWHIMEGPACFNPRSGCDTSGLVLPAYSYTHAETGGCSVTGGYVYRGTAIPGLAGEYFFADFCAGFIRSLNYETGTVTDWTDQLGNLGNITSFGTDSAGEIYITTIDGSLYRIIARG